MRKYKILKIDKSWIKNNIIKPGWQRNLYPARVNHFVNHIRNNTFERSLITVAKDDKGKFILLDGQHKIEAILKSEVIKEMDFCVYEDLDDPGMVKIYKMLNNVKQPRLIDDIKIHVGRKKNDPGRKEWLDIYMKEGFPINVTLSGGANSIRIDNLLNIIHNGRLNETKRRNLNRKIIDEFINTLDKETYSLMSEFCTFYKSCFGEPTKGNWLYRNLVVFTLFRIWKVNRNGKIIDEETLQNCFKKIEANDKIKDGSLAVDIASIDELTRRIYYTLNKGRTVNKFIFFWEEDLVLELEE